MTFQIRADKSSWATPKDDVVGDVLNPAFAEATNVRIMAGFYSPDAIRELAFGLSKFITEKTGVLRIICSQHIKREDIPSLEEAGELARLVSKQMLTDQQYAEDALIRYTREAIAMLYAESRIEIRIAVSGSGMFHKKCYLFDNGQSSILLFGSANFSVGGFRKNQESLILFRSWSSDKSPREHIQNCKEEFERIWSNNEAGMRVFDICSETIEKLVASRSTKDVPTFPEEDDFSRAKESARNLGEAFTIPSYLVWENGRYIHQSKAVYAWEENLRKGILSIATGGGKTLTSLIAAQRLYREIGSLHIIIVVPTRILAEQWAKECNLFNLNATGYESSKSTDERVECIADQITLIEEGVVRVAATVIIQNTLKSVNFQQVVRESRCNTLLIADECHNLGNVSYLATLPQRIKYRLGLSATPIRQYDDIGTERLFDYFGGEVFSFGIKDAIGVCLVPYKYYAHIVELTEAETERYADLTRKIRRLSKGLNNEGKNNIGDQHLENLIRLRGEIIENAENKIRTLDQVLSSESIESLRKSIFFCSSKRKDQIDRVHEVLRLRRLVYRQVTQDESSNAKILDKIISDFKSGSIDVITAKKVLDEGANIPEIQTAFFIASTKTEREWIQRRGRVLRMAEGKCEAVIHDFICIPNSNIETRDIKSVFERELTRAAEFAKHSCNMLDRSGGFVKIEGIRRLFKL
jgi:superfamily II DNA or RNA helicase